MTKKPRTPQGNGSERWHATLGGYTNHKCGCRRCKDAAARYAAGARLRRSKGSIPHGTPTGYFNWACRCRECGRAAKRQTYERLAAKLGTP